MLTDNQAANRVEFEGKDEEAKAAKNEDVKQDDEAKALRIESEELRQPNWSCMSDASD